MSHEYYMKAAIEQAKIAAEKGEVPVGAVIVKDGEIISVGYNRRETAKNALCHAELDAINAACEKLHGWRLWQCDLYVTLEPCPMCTGAIINARIPNVYFGAYDRKAGSCGSVVNLFDYPYNHKAQLTGGILEDECAELLSSFFRQLRNNKKTT
ncbi:MAG: tRNA adenosine(34) deaminase TadA [Clostridia bacterium]|nr:tRNA adenosine(34) deaminase TadA [Clostridia bacterium]